ncbi:2985_t:CDS:2 [Racocetra fulgida]|uniref:2985_t:CDS:1 n=1 Tax=Racocetra fulgida TaxID=60492 RepID=A0A9N8WHV0_9GLOM|nr:2985_t:CDS:2 [Racocetra fulgida]
MLDQVIQIQILRRRQNYRVSRIVVLCKDCGHDVGLYPARHKCELPQSDSFSNPVPSIPKQHLSLKNKNDTNAAGLWGKLRSVNNWKNVSEDDNVTPSISQPSQGSKLWDKLLSAAAAYNSNHDEDSEYGETHISRILREYHHQKSGDIPDWLFDSNVIVNSDDDNNRGRKLGIPIVVDRNRDHSPSDRLAVRNDQRKYSPSSLPNNFDSDMFNDKTSNTLQLPGYQRVGGDRSYQNTNRARSASPNYNFLSSSRDASSRDASSRDVSSRDVSSRDVSSRDVSSRDVSSRDGDSQYSQRSGNYRQGGFF